MAFQDVLEFRGSSKSLSVQRFTRDQKAKGTFEVGVDSKMEFINLPLTVYVYVVMTCV